MSTSHRSPELEIVTGSSATLRTVADDLSGRADVRYYLTAGAGRFGRPSWAFGRRDDEQLRPELADRSVIASVLDCDELRAMCVEEEIQAIQSWFAAPGEGPKRLVLETFGAPSRDDVAFWQACRLRLPPSRASMLVLRHDPYDSLDRQDDCQRTEILLTLLLAGGYAWAWEFDRWAELRHWEQGATETSTSSRGTAHGRLVTYAGSRERAQARQTFRALDPAVVEELATLVVATQPDPLLPSAALVPDPSLALRAFGRLACAQAAGNLSGIAEYGKNLFRRGRNHGWNGITKCTAATFWLAALLAERKQVSPTAARTMLNLAEQFGVDADVRSLFAYALGQRLAKDHRADRWTASVRCFDYVHACHRADPPEYAGVGASRHAAAYNGAALAHLRLGDHDGSIKEELAALDALAEPGVLESGGLYEQQVLVLANLARVYERSGRTEPALDCYRLGWRVSTECGSLAGMAYAATGLVRLLVETDADEEAKQVTTDLLASYDSTSTRGRDIERGVVGSCCVLADRCLSAGDVRAAAGWYEKAARRMRRGVPDMIEGMARNIRAHTEATPVLEFLSAELAAHQAIAADLEALLALLEEGERDG